MQTVLVVDDDASVRELISVILQIEGFSIFTADSGESALEVTAIHPVDVVILDISMPGMGGPALSRRLREDPATAHVPQMIISGDPDRLGPEASQLGVDAVLTKPFDFNLFIDELASIVAGRPAASADVAACRDLDEIIDRELIYPVFQPIVDLEDGSVIGVEGLARGPEGPLHSPLALFQAAHQADRLHELDALCRLAVIRAARDSTTPVPPLVFVNVEPGTLHLPRTAPLREILAEDLGFRIVTEFTERALTRRVPAVLRHAEEIRGRGNVVALDDLGVDPSSVAMLPLIQPEIIKLDMSLLGPTLSADGAAAAIAAAAYAQRTGAMIIAEGIETEAQRATAIALGAHWGQGYLFAKPGPMSALATMRVRSDTPPLPHRERVDGDAGSTPFGIARAMGVRARTGTGADLIGISSRLELQALQLGDLGAVFVTVKAADNLVGPALETYEAIARSASVLGILGSGVAVEPVPRAYGVHLEPGDALAHEWVLAVLGPHFAVVLCARGIPDSGTGEARMYEYLLSHDRNIAERIGRLLTRRLTPRAALPRTTALPAASIA